MTLLCCLILGGCAVLWTALAAGTAADPLITVSYARQIYNAAVERSAELRADALVSQKTEELQSALRRRLPTASRSAWRILWRSRCVRMQSCLPGVHGPS